MPAPKPPISVETGVQVLIHGLHGIQTDLRNCSDARDRAYADDVAHGTGEVDWREIDWPCRQERFEKRDEERARVLEKIKKNRTHCAQRGSGQEGAGAQHGVQAPDEAKDEEFKGSFDMTMLDDSGRCP